MAATDMYILDDANNVVGPVETEVWGPWFEAATKDQRRVVKKEAYSDFETEIEVSTVFLGLCHRFSSEGPPLVFETMVFGGELDQEMDRCCTWQEALAMHERMAERALPKRDPEHVYLTKPQREALAELVGKQSEESA